MKKHISILLMVSTAFSVAFSQNLHENVSVEGIFKPEVIRQEKINVLPHRENFPIERNTMAFDNNGIAANFNPTALTLPVTGWRTSRTPSLPGYLDVSLGSWLNSSLSAGYSIIKNPATSLSVSLQHNSTSLWKDKKTDTHTRFRYDESLAARFSHTFGSGVLDASFDYHLGFFNYFFCRPLTLSYNDDNEVSREKAPTQTLNDFSLRADWNATHGASSWHAGAGMRYFGYRRLYLPLPATEPVGGLRETHINVNGGWNYIWDSGSSVGIEGSGNILLYGNNVHNPSFLFPVRTTDNYGTLNLNPYYRFTKNQLTVSVGAQVDLTFNAQGDTEDSHYGVFHIAPDIRFDWRRSRLGAYLHILGGSRLNTLAGQNEMTYYNMPVLVSTQPVYTPVDARLGLEYGPYEGLNVGASIAFRASKHVVFAGWYPTLLNYGTGVAPGFKGQPGSFSYGLNPQGYDLHGFSFDIHAAFRPLKNLKFSAAMTYQPQKGRTGYFNGLDRPRWTVDAEAEYSPIKKLYISLSYNYRGVRNVYTTHELPQMENVIIGGREEMEVVGMRLPDITSLNAGVRYDLTSRISFGVKGYNLLNCRNLLLPSLPGEGIDIQGTFSFLF